MLHRLIAWSLNNTMIVIALVVVLIGVGIYSYSNVNVEAYPDPSPPIIEIVAQYPGGSAEEVERQVTVPLEITLSGMPKLKVLRSKSMFGLSHLRTQFEYTQDYNAARQEVINRLQFSQALPPGVTPQISPQSPTGEIYRYTLRSAKDPMGRDYYNLNDLKSLQDWVLEREFRRVPRIIDVTSRGGTVKRYELHLDYDRMRAKGVTLAQIQNTLSNANANAGGDLVDQGQVAMNSRSVGLLGGGQDPVTRVLGLADPAEAVRILRAEEGRRLREIRRLVVTSVNNVPILLEDVVEGGRLRPGQDPNLAPGVVIGHQTRLGRSGLTIPTDGPDGRFVSRDEDDKVECIVLMRKNEETIPALKDVKQRVKELNEPATGRMPPGVEIETYYDRADLIAVTTETVQENLLMGMALVSIVLLMFLSNVRTAIIVAINIPLALLFAFTMLYLRGKSANLLSIGAVDFGIIVDSSVIMVENIYRRLSTGENADLDVKQRVLKACVEVERALFFSTAIIVCAFVPLFTMQGAEGQIFGPMADTYAFALGGALLLAVTMAPVLCYLLLRNMKPTPDNFVVRWVRNGYLRNLRICLRHRWLTVGLFAAAIIGTYTYALPQLGREFMPELEEGNVWVRATFPLNISLKSVAESTRIARVMMARHPEIDTVVSEAGRPDDGTDPGGFFNVEFFVPMRPQREWPKTVDDTSWRRWFTGSKRTRSKEELVKDMKDELDRCFPGVDWNFSQNIRDNVMEAMSGVKGNNSVKVFGPEIQKLESIAAEIRNRLQAIQGITEVGVFNIEGNTNLEFRVDPEKCQKWGVSAADVNNVITSALGGAAFSSMLEGERKFDIATRLPAAQRGSETSILNIPIDITNNQVSAPASPGLSPSPAGGQAMASKTGTLVSTENPISNTPRIFLRDVVSPVGSTGEADPTGSFVRAGANTIYREQGQRMIAVKFSVQDRDLGGAVDEAKEKVKDVVPAPYRIVWSGEFEQMEDAEARLMVIVPASLLLIFMLLYFAFHSLLDACLVLLNVVALSLGGIWALLLTDTNFSVSAAVGFISIFGVAIMDGLMLVSFFNQNRARGLPVHEAIMEGASVRVRAVMMTDLTAIFGLVPTALATRIGSQTQKPLAIVVIGGLVTTLAIARYLMPVLYSFYGHREPPAGAGDMAH